ncbi:cytochrome c oxidase assembly factor 7 homolog [Oppia nitens]|uniref:cytochrome c oxidase assembly factor 7 homolog n=1 Tax=Oppia nitens TaxID=1686743 RepID=UPI0023DAE4B3|nr:cytochrome c oxidase assembly factor 7 homolog [Oppia nitens]
MADEIFKDFTELEQFFKNLGIEYRFNCYFEKNAQGCHLLGEYMSKIQNDLIRSNKVFKDNCNDNKFGRSCTQYGINLLTSRGCPKDLKKSLDNFLKGCELGDNEGCFYSGQLLSGSDGDYRSDIEPNIKKAMDYFEKGCEMTANSTVAAECCFYAHSHYLFGKNGCQKNADKAFKFGVKGCDLNNYDSCNNLSQMYALGLGTIKNQTMAKKYKDKTIDMIQQIKKASHIDTQRT